MKVMALIGFLMMFGGAGGVETSADTSSMLLAGVVALLGAGISFVAVRSIVDSESAR